MQKFFTLRSLRKRINAILLVVVFLFCSLAIRLFVLQIIQGPSLQLRATDQWTRELAIVAPRGAIKDCTGASMAVSYTTYNVFTRPREITDSSTVAHTLSQQLGMDFETVYNKVAKKGVSETLIKLGVDGQTAENIYSAALSGVYLAENSSRFYPYGNLASQILGFTSIDNVGQSGLEAYFDDVLTGVDGYSFVQSDLQGKEIGGSLRYYIGATAGNNLTLTLDSKIQLLLEQTLEKIMTEQKAKSVTALITTLDGKIKAISSKPSFDLNSPPRDNLSTLFDQSKVKAVTDNYEPGSTFKILTVAAALEEGVTTLQDRFYCPGYRIIDGVKIKCWKSIGHGSQTLGEAFANSCNCCFMDLALRLGKDKFYKYIQDLGLGKKTGVSISGEASGILMDKSAVKNVDLARMGFGHAVAVSPIQLASAVCAILADGRLCTPQIVEKITDTDEKTISQSKFDGRQTLISASTSQIVRGLLEGAVNKTGPCTFVEGYNVGGKTGTAQKYKETGGIDQGKYISSFIGTYPADNPQYLLLLLVDEPGAGAYYGSVVAAPYGREVFLKLFDYLQEKPVSDVKVEWTTMPDVEQKSLAEAVKLLKEAGLDYELDGEGGIVCQQLPPAGTRLQKGETVLLVVS